MGSVTPSQGSESCSSSPSGPTESWTKLVRRRQVRLARRAGGDLRRARRGAGGGRGEPAAAELLATHAEAQRVLHRSLRCRSRVRSARTQNLSGLTTQTETHSYCSFSCICDEAWTLFLFRVSFTSA